MVEIVSEPRWQPLGHPAPPDATNGCALASGPDGPVMVIQKDWRQLSVWRWSGARWVPEIADLMPGLDPTPTCPLACYSPADGGYLVGCVTGARELRLLRLDDGVVMPPVALGDVVTYSGTLLAPPSGDELVLQLSTNTLTVSQSQARLRAQEPQMSAVAADSAGGRVVGIDKSGLTCVGDFGDGAGSGWRRLDTPALAEHSMLVYDPGRDRVVCLIPDADRPVTVLHALAGDQWVPVDPPVTMPGRRTNGLLAVEAGSGPLLHFGGDLHDGETTTSAATWKSVGGDFRLIETAFDPPPIDARIPLTVDGGPAVVDIRTRSVFILRDDRWQPWTSDATDARNWQRFDARSLNFTAGGGAVWMLDAEGGAWRTDANGSFHQLAPAEPGPGSRLTREAAMAWQEPEGRLVLVGGRQRNDTWALEQGRWQRLSPQGSPPHGSGVAAATPYGVYLFVGAELWRLWADTWTCVAVAAAELADEWSDRGLCYDGRRNLLLAACFTRGLIWDEDTSVLCVIDGDQFRPVAELPGDDPHRLLAEDGFIAWDPAGDRLVGFLDGQHHELRLDSLDLDGCTLPTRPVRSHSTRLPQAPPSRLREAVPLRYGDGPVNPDWPVPTAPREYWLTAVIPADPQLLPLGKHTGLAVFAAEDIWRAADGKAFQVVMLSDPQPGAVARAEQDRPLRPIELGERFTEHHPAHWRKYDSPPRTELATSSKIGGYAHFLQGGEEEAIKGQRSRSRCSRCRSRLEFKVQLAAGLIEIGDCGSVYVYVCPRGCTARATAESL